MWTKIVLALLITNCLRSHCALNCYKAQENCRQDWVCTLAEMNYFHSCKSVLNGGIFNFNTYSCPLDCVYAIGNLTATSLGKDMESCDCEMDANCLTLKARTRRCLAASKRQLQNKTGCTAVRTQCARDPVCSMAERNFLIKCSQLISGVECSEECLQSQEELFSLEKAKKLKSDCECDGFGEQYCHGIRAHADKLCFSEKLHPPTPNGRLVFAIEAGTHSSARTTTHSPLVLGFLISSMVYLNL